MSERNVELHRRIVEAYNARDLESFLAVSDPSVEFHAAWAAVVPMAYHGHEGIRTWVQETEAALSEFQMTPEAYFDLGEHTLVFHVLRVRGRQSGAEVGMSGAVVARWRDGLCVYVRSYIHREDALSDLGVSEDELEPIEP
jgi:ketosteroid isomerase-like protein